MDDNEKSQAPEFIDLLLWICLACAKRWRAIGLSVFIVALGGVVLVKYVLPEVFEAKAVILPPKASKGGSFDGLDDIASSLGSLSSGFSMLNSSSQETDLMMAIMESYAFQKSVITKLSLDSVYEFHKREKYFEADLIKAFRRNFKAETDDYDYLVISMRDKSPQRAKDIADTIVRMLDSAYVSLKVSQASKARAFFDERIKLNNAVTDSLKDAMQKFQEKHSLLDPGVQIEESIKHLAKLEAEKETAYIRWQAECKSYGCDGVVAKKLEDQYNSVANMLAEKKGTASASGAWMNMNKAPNLIREYEELYSALQVQEAIYKNLRIMYEQALLEEMDKVGRFEVIEMPWVNNKRVSPPRMGIVSSLVMIAFILSVLMCAFFEMLENEKGRQGKRYQKLRHICNALLLKKVAD